MQVLEVRAGRVVVPVAVAGFVIVVALCLCLFLLFFAEGLILYLPKRGMSDQMVHVHDAVQVVISCSNACANSSSASTRKGLASRPSALALILSERSTLPR